MKKNKVKTILIVLIILIVCLNVVVYAAYALPAIEVSYTKSDGKSTSVKEALDELYTKVPTHEIGDEVTVGGEPFYVLEWDNNSDMVRLISKYNLNTAGTAQQDADISKTSGVFSGLHYWNNSFTSDPYNLNDLIGFESTDSIGRAKSYGMSKGAVSSGLLSKEEASALATKASSNTKIATMLWGNDSYNGYLHYWLGSSPSLFGVYTVIGNARRISVSQGNSTGITYTQGVRPVITVLKSKIS